MPGQMRFEASRNNCFGNTATRELEFIFSKDYFVEMTSSTAANRCVHCLTPTDDLTADHVFPKSWYPDTTACTVQRWTVPSCRDCNCKLGELEKDLLIRMALCVDPKSEGASGLAARVFRSLGLDVESLTAEERTHREASLAKLRSELMPHSKVASRSGAIPGLGPPAGAPVKWSIPIPWAGLSIITEKIARGCEYKLRRRFLEAPYGIRTFVMETGEVPEAYAAKSEVFDFGSGYRIRRLFATEDPKIVLYWISIWNALHLNAIIDLEDDLKRRDSGRQRPEGLEPDDMAAFMKISPYLRQQR